MQKIDLKLLITALKSIGFTVLATLVLATLHWTGAFPVEAGSWRFLLMLVGFFIVHWIVRVALVTYQSDKAEATRKSKAVMWGAAAAATLLLFMLIFVLLYVISPNDFFVVDPLNFFVGFAIIAGIIVLAHIIDYIVRITIRTVKYGDQIPDYKEGQKIANGDFGGQAAAAEKPEDAPVFFPDLLEMDAHYEETPYTEPEDIEGLTLTRLVEGFNRYLECNDMFYPMEAIRSFLAGLACSHFLILEGLSGTGKTSLPKYFAEYTRSNVCFTSVQASWKDRSDILGYYNDFAKKFVETPFLRGLYRANYETKTISMMVLDEMNLSRVEYYFADFLSILELDARQWNIPLMAVSTSGNLPAKLSDCTIHIPHNTWFIGTANKDDSTFTITDKVYDRAVVIDFSERKEVVHVQRKEPRIRLNKDQLVSMFERVLAEHPMEQRDYKKFSDLSSFMYDTFDVNFGNRIMNQVQVFVPIYVACGGTAYKALDLMFARKVLRKIEGRFEENLKQNLGKLEEYVKKEFTEKEFSATLSTIAKMKRKLA